MEIEIRFDGLEASEPLREQAALLVQTHFGRFVAELTRVSVIVGRRMLGPSRTELRYQVTADGPRIPETTVDHRGRDLLAALATAIALAARAVKRDLRRTGPPRDGQSASGRSSSVRKSSGRDAVSGVTVYTSKKSSVPRSPRVATHRSSSGQAPGRPS